MLNTFNKLQLPPSVMSPESAAFDRGGEGPYVTVADGRILRWEGSNVGFVDFAYTSPNRTKNLCDCTNDLNLGPICGRPMALSFNYKSSDLYITDAFFGLLVMHLFDINIPGKIIFEESKTLTAGETPTVVDTGVGRIGIGVCYDIRFQELAMLYAARGTHLLCYPRAFNMITGPLHWELLQRARAVDNQMLFLHLLKAMISFVLE